MAYGDFEDLNRRTAAEKVLRNKAFNISKNPKYDGYQRRLSSMVYNFFDKKNLVKQLKIKLYLITDEIHSKIIKKFNKWKHTHFL